MTSTSTPTSTYPVTGKTGQQLRTEVVQAMNDAITASGIPDGWGLRAEPDSKQWNPDTVEFLGDGCTTVPGTDGKRFETGQYHLPEGDPVAFAQRMGEHWESQSYTVSTVGQVEGEDPSLDLRADRPDGTLFAGVVGSSILLNITIYSECSSHPTMKMFAGPTGYRIFDLSDPYNPTTPPTITPYPTPRDKEEPEPTTGPS